MLNHSQEETISPGEFINCDIDLVMVHEQLGGRISEEYKKLGIDYVWDPKKIFFILDHWVPAPSISASKMHQACRKFAEKYNFAHDMGMDKGICHQVLPEYGFSRPGMLIVGSDSHTTTYGAFNCLSTGIGATDVSIVFATGQLWFKVPNSYKINLKNNLNKGTMSKDFILTLIGDLTTKGAIYKSLEFHGNGATNLSIESRMTVSNMVVEAGAMCGIFIPDEKLKKWLANKTKKKYRFIFPDEGASYEKVIDYDLSEIIPVVATPSNPGNVVPVEKVEGIEIDQAFLGSCTNGRFEDLKIAADLLKKHNFQINSRLIITPASKKVYEAALKTELIKIFLDSGAIITNPTCGACIGGHLGVLGPDEVCISSTNRNFVGRMGDPTSKVYLASPATVIASAIKGKITDPRELMD
ncbi:MAG: 3-isopropylmalate dehydratase large subunit 1 [Promethearchaeota archaeon]|nr:MAG: 3-isopropylmalate dehydratase large subunit 1 [Candidatus Lokiarchaeota archaeon]